MKEVSKDDFFKIIGPMNVHPWPQGHWSNDIGYKCLWKLPNQKVIGITQGVEINKNQQYFLV